MKQLTCIICPIGCRISAEVQNNNYVFSGNSCKRGEEFAEKELTSPKRTLTTTVRTIFPETPVIPVKTSTEIPKHLISSVMSELAKVLIKDKAGIGATIICNILDTGCDIVVTSDALRIER